METTPKLYGTRLTAEETRYHAGRIIALYGGQVMAAAAIGVTQPTISVWLRGLHTAPGWLASIGISDTCKKD